ncbi:SDR family oxidoreductase [Cellulosimicrobium sp. Marseille-Q8652]
MSVPATSTPATEVVVVIGAGAIGQAIVRRVAAGRTVLVADVDDDNAAAAARNLEGAGYRVTTGHVDVSDGASVSALAEQAAALGAVSRVIHTAGLSPAQASPQAIIAVDLVGTAHVLEAFGRVVAPGGSGIVIASQAGHMIPPLPADQNEALSRTPAGDLTDLPMLQADAVPSSGFAYALAKRANVLRVQASSVGWGDRSARLNSLSPGIIMTPLALDEFNGPAGEAYQEMVRTSAAGRVGSPDEVAAAAAFLLGPDGAFVTGTDLLIDGGVIASILSGRFQVQMG